MIALEIIGGFIIVGLLVLGVFKWFELENIKITRTDKTPVIEHNEEKKDE